MSTIVLAVVAVTMIGLICAVILAIASKVMAVPVNETYAKVRECLPGANCGACGYAGCDGYADALANGMTDQVNLCVPGGNSVARQVGAVLGVDAGEVTPKVAVIHCGGNCDSTGLRTDYQGIHSCAAAMLMYGGNGNCVFGCIGYGDCMSVCPQNAICIERGIAHVDPRACEGCGQCAKKCPKNLITIENRTVKTLVTCHNQDKGALTRKVCSHGCIGCYKCVKACPEQAITVENFLARIDYSKCRNCGECAKVCTTGCIVLSDFGPAPVMEEAVD